jgi:hypothetical protein
MLPPPAPIDIYSRRLNLTTTTSKELIDLNNNPAKYGEDFKPLDSVFHPFDGWFAKNSLLIPMGYVLWGMSVVPNWAFMLIVSFISRSMM